MRSFSTYGRVRPEQHYIVPRTTEIAALHRRIKAGRYVVLFAPRQTGKTTFFRLALDKLLAEDPAYFPIQLDFQMMRGASPATFYHHLAEMIQEQIEVVFQKRAETLPKSLTRFFAQTPITDHFSLRQFFKHLAAFSTEQESPFRRVVLLIDEFDGIPDTVLSDFLYTLRQIYLSDELHCPYSLGIVGVKSIAQLRYDRSVSPFNIQDEFRLPNFTHQQVSDLLSQYTEEVGQPFETDVITAIHKQTNGQPFLVNRLAQILTEELSVPKTAPLTATHFAEAHRRLLEEDNTHLTHLITNIRRDHRFGDLLMRITAAEEGVRFNLRDEQISELLTYGVIGKSADGFCEVVNPVYLYCILQTFKPPINGLEDRYLPEENTAGFQHYLTPTGEIDTVALLDNFRDFISRAGFHILQVPETPRESVGRYLLLAYLDQFIGSVGGMIHVEVQTGRGRLDLLITHNSKKYIVETKVWRGRSAYTAGKRQLAASLKLEGVTEGYYVVFDHRATPMPRVETERVEGITIRSYVIPVVQHQPSALSG